MSTLWGGVVPVPPVGICCNPHVLPAGTVLHRIHHAQFAPVAFNPGLGCSRFAPCVVEGRKIPTAYAASSFECAVYETIFHEIAADAPFRSVRWSSLRDLTYSRLGVVRDLSLASLYSADLMRLGIERSQLIDTPKSSYPDTQKWAAAIHASSTTPDGLIWVSRRYDQERALMLYGGRVSEARDLQVISTVALATDASTLAVVEEQAHRSGITIVR